MLPNLNALALSPNADTDLVYEHLNGSEMERRGRARIDKLHRDRVRSYLRKKGEDFRTAGPNELRHNWQYFFGRYRNENDIEEINNQPNDIQKVLRKKKPAPLVKPAYHGEITFDSPDNHEFLSHPYEWWLIRYVAQNYHEIDRAVQQLLNNIVRDATYFVHGEKTALVVREHYNKKIRDGSTPGRIEKPPKNDAFGGQPSPAAWYWWMEERAWAQSLHVGHSSYHGISLYWRMSGEIHEYLNMSVPSGRKEFFKGSTMHAPWITEVYQDANTEIITPKQLFEYILRKKVLELAGVDTSCIQERDATHKFQKAFGTQINQYRVKFDMPDDLKKYGPSCDDPWPVWKVLPKDEL